jgi:hypothetical protein
MSSRDNKHHEMTTTTAQICINQQQEQALPGNNDDEEIVGVHQKKRMLLPKVTDNGLNRAMAEAAAAKYEQDKGRIRQACAEIDNPTPPKSAESSSCCIIL